MATLDDLQERIRAFSEARDWDRFHGAKNLAMALAGEVGELSSLLQWVEPGDVGSWLASSDNRDALSSEMADILTYFLLLASAVDIDPIAAAMAKLELNEDRYPVAAARGRSAKYTDL